jgi:hypothetical protein
MKDSVKTPFGDPQCQADFLGTRCEEPLNHEGAHQARVYNTGPDYGVDYVEVWPNLAKIAEHQEGRTN